MSQEILDDLEYNDSEIECGVCDNEREEPSSDESEVAVEINLNKAKPEDVTAQEVRHENRWDRKGIHIAIVITTPLLYIHVEKLY